MLVRCGDRHATRHIAFLDLDRDLGRHRQGLFTLELARTVAGMAHVRATFCLARGSRTLELLAGCNCRLLPIESFDGPGGPLARGARVRTLYRNVLGELAAQRSAGIVALMPRARTPLLAPLVRSRGFRYLAVLDPAGPQCGRAQRDAARDADTVITLSRSVADALAASGTVTRERLVALFHPDLHLGGLNGVRPGGSDASDTFRVLVLASGGASKGLPAVMEAVQRLNTEGLPVTLGVITGGLTAPDPEVADVLARYHAVALPCEADSPCTDAAIALGAGLPVVGARATGLCEQVRHGVTGMLAAGNDPASLAAAIQRLGTDARLYRTIRANIRRTAWERSMRRFAEHLIAHATDTTASPSSTPPQELTWV